jgi:hypothetical protein
MAKRGNWFRLTCLLRGHDDFVRRMPRRLYLECAECGRETPGWDLTIERDRHQPERELPARPWADAIAAFTAAARSAWHTFGFR